MIVRNALNAKPNQGLVPSLKKLVEKKEYTLASLTRISFARFFDLLIVSIFQFLVSFFVGKPAGDFTSIAIVMSSNLLILGVYFIGLPLFFHGNSLGKLIFNIRLKTQREDQKIKWYMIFLRELYFWFIPWFISLISTVLAIVILNANQDDGLNFSAYFIFNLGYLFFLFWYLFLALTIKIQNQHQAGVDLKFDLYVVNANPLLKPEPKKVIRPEIYDHISLTEMPGNFDEENLKELVNNQEKEFNKSINLTDLDTEAKPKKLTDSTKTIEHKKELEQ